jgi:hypothetical protein
MKNQTRVVLLCAAILTTVLGLFTNNLCAQSLDSGSSDSDATINPNLPTLNWTEIAKYDTGSYPALAMHATGLIVELHTTESLSHSGLYYHIGKLDRDKGTVTWGSSYLFISAGSWPAVAITKEGYVIITFSDGFYNSSSNLKYLVGTVDPNGDTSQTINFKTNKSGTKFDTGFHDSVSVNGLGVIAEAHQSGQGGDGIFYRLGHLTNPSAGDFSITWDSGTGGHRYDKGVDPKISVNDDNDVVEVHGVSNENKLHYGRGKVINNSSIQFESDHPRLDSEGYRANVVLLNNSSIIEVNRRSNARVTGTDGIYYRTGALSGQHQIRWSEPQIIAGTDKHHNPAVAANPTDAVVSFESSSEGIFKSIYLRYSTAKLP